ncbi:hypothetical protein LEP1GSC047_1841 [Leptospira inadai serovar Lyme str. 10]|uniref:PF13590 domain protein n=2 Tax=Leptospira inadai serovar Lyme TaxID=293084 RepID=V6HH24_9LEPT|nr:hypothetical protein [Leptospira inadai]EQA35305.1 hypothetical protein LEP1GSC047_1841 [Leptospira inadai serovar Lyme str. 10]PNV73938.1 hypothetical protein BES34_016090 [Leptospira inadai serovar Lyme]
MRIRFLLLFIYSISCSPLVVKSGVEVSQSRQITLYAKTFAFLPFVGEASRIQIAEHEDLIRSKFIEKGFREVEMNRADLLIAYDILTYPRGTVIPNSIPLGASGGWLTRRGLRYHSDGDTVRGSFGIPFLGGLAGGYGSNGMYSGYGGYYFGGGYGAYQRSYTRSYYDTSYYDIIFKMLIYDGRVYRGKPFSVLLEANIEGEGRSGYLFDVVPYLIASFFKSFPNFNGQKMETISEYEVGFDD